jgi:hypothetical protein
MLQLQSMPMSEGYSPADRLSNSAVFVCLCPTIAQLQEDNRGLSDASSTELFQRDSASGFAMCGIVSCSSCSFDD